MTERSDELVLNQMVFFSRNERRGQVRWLKCLAEVDKRRLYALSGFPSLFAYVHKVLKYSEGSVGKRIQVMRTAEKFPLVYALLEDCRISMAVVSRLSPVLTDENHVSVLEKASGMSTEQAQVLAAGLCPRPEVIDSIRQGTIPTDVSPAPEKAAPVKKKKEIVAPLSEARFHMNFTVDKETAEKHKRLKEVSHQGITMEEVYKAGLEVLLNKHDPKVKYEKATKPRVSRVKKHTRYVSQETRCEVWKRDDGRCAYVSPGGHRCEATTGIEFEHRQPWGMGGSSRDVGNIQLLCRSHNLFRAMQCYGKESIQKYLGIPSRNVLGRGPS